MSRLRPEILFLPNRDGVRRVPLPLRAVVVGGGIAGMAAATVLVERGVHVTLLERERALGGRAGGFEECLPTGERVQMERGFHGFFRQYYNAARALRRVDPGARRCCAARDYPVLGPERRWCRRSAGCRSGRRLQVAALALRTPYLRAAERCPHRTAEPRSRCWPSTASGPTPASTGRPRRTTSTSLGLPERARRMLFDVFAHSFFNPEGEMSAAELLMMFHFYFTGNPEGLVFDVAARAARRGAVGAVRPLALGAGRRGARRRVRRARDTQRAGGGSRSSTPAARSEGELLVLALDVGGLRRLSQRSPDLAALHGAVGALSETRPFAVLRLWLDRPVRADRAAFAGTTGIGLLDNISVYERFQGESAAWARDARRLRSSSCTRTPWRRSTARPACAPTCSPACAPSIPRRRSRASSTSASSGGATVPRSVPGTTRGVPASATALPDVALAGDGIRVPVPCALMERAAVSGVLAANALLAPSGVASEPIRSVPHRGLFAPLRLPRLAVELRTRWKHVQPLARPTR